MTLYPPYASRSPHPRVPIISALSVALLFLALSQLATAFALQYSLLRNAFVETYSGTSRGGAEGEEVVERLPSLLDSPEPPPSSPPVDLNGTIPTYVLEHAPYVHLYSGEQFWPCDISEHLLHTTPHLNYTPIYSHTRHPNLTNLADLNEWGRFVYLQSEDNVEERPAWLGGSGNIPSPGEPEGEESWHGRDGQRRLAGWQHGKTTDNVGRSDAPAILIVIGKPDGIVDAFWFFFYSYNLGNVVAWTRFGNHVGDWEHTVVRFKDGKPTEVFYSEHYFGQAYTYDAVEKMGKRVSCPPSR